MPLLRYYRLTAAEGRGSDLRVALQSLAVKLAQLPQSLKTEIFVDPNAPGTFVFIEHWRSQEDQKTAGAILGKNAFAEIGSVIAGPPESRYLVPVEQSLDLGHGARTDE